MLHTASGRGPEPFVKVDCGARLPEELAGRLFGRQGKAHAGAERRRLGAIEFAHRGTLFLDNLEALPPALHPDVLRFLQSRTFVRAGTTTALAVDVRIVLATAEALASSHGDLQLSGRSPLLKVLDLQAATVARPARSHRAARGVLPRPFQCLVRSERLADRRGPLPARRLLVAGEHP
jgi:transcriptional regulator with AAA-type ATPase domain